MCPLCRRNPPFGSSPGWEERGTNCSSALLSRFRHLRATIPVMTDQATADPGRTATSQWREPPRVRAPKLVQAVGFAVFRRRAMRNWIRWHGRIFEINVPFFGRSVVVSDPDLVRSVCTAGTEQLINVVPNM